MNKLLLSVLVLLISCALLVGCSSSSKPVSLKERIDQYYDTCNAGDIDKMKSFYSAKLLNQDVIIKERVKFQKAGAKMKSPIISQNGSSLAQSIEYVFLNDKDNDLPNADVRTWEKENENWYIIQ